MFTNGLLQNIIVFQSKEYKRSRPYKHQVLMRFHIRFPRTRVQSNMKLNHDHTPEANRHHPIQNVTMIIIIELMHFNL